MAFGREAAVATGVVGIGSGESVGPAVGDQHLRRVLLGLGVGGILAMVADGRFGWRWLGWWRLVFFVLGQLE